jgi:hypothetical protein
MDLLEVTKLRSVNVPVVAYTSETPLEEKREVCTLQMRAVMLTLGFLADN